MRPLSLLEQPEEPDHAGNDVSADVLLPAPAGWPTPPDRAVYHELPGEIVNTIAPHTEADRATRGRTFTSELPDWRFG